MAEIFTEEADKYFMNKCLEHQKKIKEKVGESIVRFKGSRDVDLYGKEEDMRSKLAYQLRNQDKEYLRDLKNGSSLFPILDEQFFTPQRPIFFEEAAEALQKDKDYTSPNQILVIMVHGLGACRLDMEKIKAEMRRYYDHRVKIYISTSNEARTEGNIEDMGIRLASEVDYELGKYL